MSIVTFWNDTREQVGKTLTAVAVATQMAIQHNFKVLLISTSYADPTIKNCYWTDKLQRKLGIFERGNNIAVESGIEGLSKLVKSNKIQPNIITDYTKVIFKGRLEVLFGFSGSIEDTEEEKKRKYQDLEECFPELIRLANLYYDMVLVDLDKELSEKIKKEMLSFSNLNVLVISQRLYGINYYKNIKGNNQSLLSPKNITVIGKYIDKTKFNLKNINRYLGIKEKISLVPFNILFYEAAEEATVPDLFLKLRKMTDTSDINYFFVDETLKLTNRIVDRIKELQKKMG